VGVTSSPVETLKSVVNPRYSNSWTWPTCRRVACHILWIKHVDKQPEFGNLGLISILCTNDLLLLLLLLWWWWWWWWCVNICLQMDWHRASRIDQQIGYGLDSSIDTFDLMESLETWTWWCKKHNLYRSIPSNGHFFWWFLCYNARTGSLKLKRREPWKMVRWDQKKHCW